MIDFLENYEDLTTSEKKVLTHMVDHKKEIPYMTINQLAQDIYVSKTVIVNLSQKLGYSGFKELKYAINQEELQEKIRQEGSSQTSVKDTMANSIDKTMSLVLDKQLAECSDKLLKANNIFIMARGTSKSVGYYLEYMLFSMGIYCFFIKDYNLTESFINLVTENDVVILISLSGSTKKILEAAGNVRLKKAKVISITSFQSNTLPSYADLSLYSHTERTDTSTNDSISRIGFFILVDLIIGTLKKELASK